MLGNKRARRSRRRRPLSREEPAEVIQRRFVRGRLRSQSVEKQSNVCKRDRERKREIEENDKVRVAHGVHLHCRNDNTHVRRIGLVVLKLSERDGETAEKKNIREEGRVRRRKEKTVKLLKQITGSVLHQSRLAEMKNYRVNSHQSHDTRKKVLSTQEIT